ncbi:centrosomal protein of 162 kDa [Tachysurus ichikawai]
MQEEKQTLQVDLQMVKKRKGLGKSTSDLYLGYSRLLSVLDDKGFEGLELLEKKPKEEVAALMKRLPSSS